MKAPRRINLRKQQAESESVRQRKLADLTAAISAARGRI
jgi:hypothetical protein